MPNFLVPFTGQGGGWLLFISFHPPTVAASSDFRVSSRCPRHHRSYRDSLSSFCLVTTTTTITIAITTTTTTTTTTTVVYFEVSIERVPTVSLPPFVSQRKLWMGKPHFPSFHIFHEPRLLLFAQHTQPTLSLPAVCARGCCCFPHKLTSLFTAVCVRRTFSVITIRPHKYKSSSRREALTACIFFV
uniref:Putative secreted protein n=1 Tax=Anopheles triannulatus TaxID=58253 RepID=A0A2M4B1B0_9DIPT